MPAASSADGHAKPFPPQPNPRPQSPSSYIQLSKSSEKPSLGEQQNSVTSGEWLERDRLRLPCCPCLRLPCFALSSVFGSAPPLFLFRLESMPVGFFQ
jgi:hypothetical protein